MERPFGCLASHTGMRWEGERIIGRKILTARRDNESASGDGVMATCDDPGVTGAQTRPLHTPFRST